MTTQLDAEPAAVTISSDGRVFVVYRQAGVEEIDPASGEGITRWDVGGSVVTAVSVACCVDGRMAVPVGGASLVALLDPDTGEIQEIPVSGVVSTVLGPEGALYAFTVRDIMRIDPQTFTVTVIDLPFSTPPPDVAAYGSP